MTLSGSLSRKESAGAVCDHCDGTGWIFESCGRSEHEYVCDCPETPCGNCNPYLGCDIDHDCEGAHCHVCLAHFMAWRERGGGL